MALAQPPVLFFDANTQDDDDEAWANSGSAGGAVPQTDDRPTLEEGTVEVAGMSFFTKYYTVPDSHAVFANDEPLDDTPEVFLENWTWGSLVRINGSRFPGGAEEHHMYGIHSNAPEENQTMRVMLPFDEGDWGWIDNVNIMQTAIGVREDHESIADTGLDLGQGVWRFMHVAFESGIAVTFYLDGEETGEVPSEVTFDLKHPMNLHALFANSAGESVQACNCSAVYFKLWDRWLSADEINADMAQTVGGTTAVESLDKLATTWGQIKHSR
jgi:hypothetical protein